ncbi:MAG: glutamate 5-kinase [Streptococcaceae bacterium]|jgi:glutamate 5-kinase|nr:glutamate 5-kinase [Streptococcaceae bacterium]
MMRKKITKAKRIVVKVGTSTLLLPNGKLNLSCFDRLAFVLSDLNNRGYEVILVSSGAIGVGLNELGLSSRPKEIPKQQAIASVGQVQLMNLYTNQFKLYGQITSQLLLTQDVTSFPESRENVINALNALIDMQIIPIINENDSVALDELDHETRFGDNDKLSAIVAQLISADLLIMLSDIDGLYDKNPNIYDDAKIIPNLRVITPEILQIASGAGSRFGTGGMTSKLKAAEFLFENQLDMVLTSGKNPDIIFDVLKGKNIGTYFESEEKDD